MTIPTKAKFLPILAGAIMVPAMSMAQTYTGPDYTDAVEAATTSIKDQLVNNLPAVFGLMAITIGLGLIFKFVRRAAR